ncbi:HXXEE domain-containing protein [Priestia megaterium]|uniref:HXXEE domain-containing protein n=1 Tax=Priestia megaterium TaxID=1404 RepID=UPI0026E479E8|nr:HXXEE domain-containing protein [Priestia megaterium]MDO6851925.1 HXXEE domain-containing protein [Priestia megaterium]
MNSSYIILFLFAITIHNLEEAVWLSRRSTKLNNIKMIKPVKQDNFLFGLFVVTALAYLITALYIFYPSNFIIKYAYFGFLNSMIINIFFPHLISTVIDRCYSPGLLTGIAVILPTNTLIIKKALDTMIISKTPFIIGTIFVAIFLLSIIPLSFKAGEKVIKF